MLPPVIEASLPINKEDNFRVLYLPYGVGQRNLMIEMAKASSFRSFMLLEIPDIERVSSLNQEITFILNSRDALASLEMFSRVVTATSFKTRLLPEGIANIIERSRTLGIPIVDVPHGLFQPARNMTDNSVVIDHASGIHGMGDIIPSFADTSVSWFGEDGVGYPRFQPWKTKNSSLVLPSYTVVTTNTNWYIYSTEDRRRLFHSLFSYMEKNSDRLFIWAMHPSENTDGQYAQIVSNRRPVNCLIYGLLDDILFDGLATTEDLIAHAESGITTLSTCILDYEIHKVPLHVFDCRGSKKLVDSMESVSTFSNEHDLENAPIKPITGYLEPYNPRAFDEKLLGAAYSNIHMADISRYLA